jgi:hypothetical protein
MSMMITTVTIPVIALSRSPESAKMHPLLNVVGKVGSI